MTRAPKTAPVRRTAAVHEKGGVIVTNRRATQDNPAEVEEIRCNGCGTWRDLSQEELDDATARPCPACGGGTYIRGPGAAAWRPPAPAAKSRRGK